MRNKAVQMSLFNIYNGVLSSIEEKKPELITLLEEHIDFDCLIPARFFTVIPAESISIISEVFCAL